MTWSDEEAPQQPSRRRTSFEELTAVACTPQYGSALCDGSDLVRVLRRDDEPFLEGRRMTWYERSAVPQSLAAERRALCDPILPHPSR